MPNRPHFCMENAMNCTGNSTGNIGLQSTVNASNCVGVSTSGASGLTARTASFCRGTRSGGVATNAIGCGVGGGSVTASFKSPGTP